MFIPSTLNSFIEHALDWMKDFEGSRETLKEEGESAHHITKFMTGSLKKISQWSFSKQNKNNS